jgi:hypothetical protein
MKRLNFFLHNSLMGEQSTIDELLIGHHQKTKQKTKYVTWQNPGWVMMGCSTLVTHAFSPQDHHSY